MILRIVYKIKHSSRIQVLCNKNVTMNSLEVNLQKVRNLHWRVYNYFCLFLHDIIVLKSNQITV